MSIQPATDEEISDALDWLKQYPTAGRYECTVEDILSLIARIQVERENAIRECAAICADIYPYADTYSDKILNMLPPKPSSQPSELIQRDIDSRRERIARKL